MFVVLFSERSPFLEEARKAVEIKKTILSVSRVLFKIGPSVRKVVAKFTKMKFSSIPDNGEDVKVCPYPGFDLDGDYNTPRAPPRVKPEAQEYADKNKGSLQLFGSGTPRPIAPTPRPEPKCPSTEGMRNYELGRHGTVSNLLNGSATPRPDPAPAPKMRPEAMGIAGGHSGQSTANLFTQYGKLPMSARAAPRIKPEAEGAYEPHKGNNMKCLLHDPKKLPASARAVPRVKPEAAGIACKEGRGMMKNQYKYASGALSDRPEPRVKPEASENAEKGKGNAMKALQYDYGHQRASPRPEPRVKEEASGMANLDKGGHMSRLMHEGSKMRKSPRPPPRATTTEAKHILRKSQGQMSQIFASSAKMTLVPKAGR
ncbi:unnamed protein product [Mytilus coruscus]|uniref:Uncharacterized protein n=1 Tax=Mytilus coruscus TaxID=42192 RepID=A0A6J8A7M7_MYTCO|nr:unnamed protein product [Mytilus coruscus]